MYTQQKIAEFTDLLFATIDRETQKNEKDINTALVDECFEFLSKLNALEVPDSGELAKRIKTITSCAQNRIQKKRRKRFRLRLIAAIITLFILMGSVVYTFYDEIEELFRTAKPGVHYSTENVDLEISTNSNQYFTIEELQETCDTPLWLPISIPNRFKLSNANTSNYSQNELILLIWEDENDRITYTAQIELTLSEIPLYKNNNYNYTAPNGNQFLILSTNGIYEAHSIIDEVYYTIQTTDKELLYEVIDSLSLLN